MVTPLKFTLLIALSCLFFWSNIVDACDFCMAPQRTMSEEIDSSDVALIVELTEKAVQDKNPEKNEDGFVEELNKSKFKILEILKGNKHVEKKKHFEWLYFGAGKKGSKYLVLGVQPPKLIWTSPISLKEEGAEYVKKAMSLPKKGHQRLIFFQDYLENKDEMIARDAYDEFAKTPYSVIENMKKDLKHDQLVKWIKDKDTLTASQRLYYTLLGICGNEEDIPMLEKNIKSTDSKTRAGLDALTACYLVLKGPKGLDFIDKHLMANKKTSYMHLFSTIKALEFMGTKKEKVIPKKRILKSLRLILDNPDMADLVIPILARWEDWSIVDKLMELFKQGNTSKNNFVKYPVINYLSICPNKDAKDALETIKKIDPEAIKKAKLYFNFIEEAEKKTKPPKPADEKKKTAKKTVATPGLTDPTINAEQSKAKPNQTQRDTTANTNSTSSADENKLIVWLPLISIVTMLVLLGVLWAIRQPGKQSAV